MRTRTTLTATLVALLAVTGIGVVAPTAPSGAAEPDDIVVFTSQLLAENETGGGLEGASGVAIVTVDKLNDIACIELVTSGMDLTAGHIHVGGAGVDGGVVVDFGLTGVDPDSCVEVDSAVADAIDLDPAGYYVNLHTAGRPAGAIRGQLGLPNPPPLTPLVATMSGLEEVPGPGDPDGTGSAYFWVDLVLNEICYSGTTDMIATPTAAHIHFGAAGASGGVAVTLDHTDLMGCAAVAGPLALDIATNPENFYINVHNAEFPAGAVRGQLGDPDDAGSFGGRRAVAPVRGLEEVTPGDPDGSGMAVLDLFPGTGQVCFELNLRDFEVPSAAHIHRGPADVNGSVVVDFAVGANGDQGCVDSNSDLVNEILDSPSEFYVNVHTASFPAGAGRGQIVVLPQGIYGTVTDGDEPAMPVVDTWVHFYEWGFGDDLTFEGGAPTGPDGRYAHMGITAGSAIVSHQSEAYTGAYVRDLLPGQIQRRDIDFADVSYAEGSLSDADTGGPVADINVCLDDRLPPLPGIDPVDPVPCDEATTVMTDEDGEWWMQITPGVYTARFGDPAGIYESDVTNPRQRNVGPEETRNFADFDIYRCIGSLFGDVAASHAFCLEISWMAITEISTGFEDGTWRPTNGVTRQALAAFIWRLAGEPAAAEDAPEFSDVPEDHPFYDAITWMAGEGIANGFSDGTFRPGGVLTRQALSAFFHRLAGEPDVTLPDPLPFTDVPSTHPFVEEITWMADTGLSTGFPGPGETAVFRPGSDVTRQALSAFLYRGVRLENLIAFG